MKKKFTDDLELKEEIISQLRMSMESHIAHVLIRNYIQTIKFVLVRNLEKKFQ